jgi:hypothetical protein
MAIDWKKVASERLKKIRQLEYMLAEDRKNVARRARRTFERLMHAKCLASYAVPPWSTLLDEVERFIAEDGK